MPPGLPMRPAPRTSTPVIGARDFLLHRGGAVDETTRETQAHFQLAVSIWHMLEHKLGTPDIPLSAEFDKLYACHAHSGQEVCLRLRTSHTSLVACARAHALDWCRAILWLKRLPEQRLDHTSSAGCRVGHGLAVHGRRDPRCVF